MRVGRPLGVMAKDVLTYQQNRVAHAHGWSPVFMIVRASRAETVAPRHNLEKVTHCREAAVIPDLLILGRKPVHLRPPTHN
jgi:hypothetical protein